jgi:hypothetical protein
MTERLETLKKARERMAEDRDAFAKTLAAPFDRDKAERARLKFIEPQVLIDAIDGDQALSTGRRSLSDRLHCALNAALELAIALEPARARERQYLRHNDIRDSRGEFLILLWNRPALRVKPAFRPASRRSARRRAGLHRPGNARPRPPRW